MPNPRGSEAALAIENDIRRHCPEGYAETGVFSELARTHNLTRERIRQIAANIGITGPRTLTGSCTVCVCGAPLPTGATELCHACRMVTLPCAICGNSVTRSTDSILATIKKSGDSATGAILCENPRCRGQFLADIPHPNRHPPVYERVISPTCAHGHPRTPETMRVYINNKGYLLRTCKICAKERYQPKRLSVEAKEQQP